jgi:adenylate kinase family enzyme
MEEVRKWLGAGSINIFGVPLAGKDTVGGRLAEALGGRFLSSGAIIREAASEGRDGYTNDEYAEGKLTPTELFSKWVLPYFGKEELRGAPLILSSIGRWSGEEDVVMRALDEAGHAEKVVVFLELAEDAIWRRWESASTNGDRVGRVDDLTRQVLETRLVEFREKTQPVVRHYEGLGLLVRVDAEGTREEVFKRVVEGIYEFAMKNPTELSGLV